MRPLTLRMAGLCLGLTLGPAMADQITLPDGPGRDGVYAR